MDNKTKLDLIDVALNGVKAELERIKHARSVSEVKHVTRLVAQCKNLITLYKENPNKCTEAEIENVLNTLKVSTLARTN